MTLDASWGQNSLCLVHVRVLSAQDDTSQESDTVHWPTAFLTFWTCGSYWSSKSKADLTINMPTFTHYFSSNYVAAMIRKIQIQWKAFLNLWLPFAVYSFHQWTLDIYLLHYYNWGNPPQHTHTQNDIKSSPQTHTSLNRTAERHLRIVPIVNKGKCFPPYAKKINPLG